MRGHVGVVVTLFFAAPSTRVECAAWRRRRREDRDEALSGGSSGSDPFASVVEAARMSSAVEAARLLPTKSRLLHPERVDPLLTARAPLEGYCSGRRGSKDVIIYLGQKQHSSYDATHANTLNASMASLRANYKKVGETDVIVWHEGDLGPSDANALDGAANVRFCLLVNATGWALPPWINPARLPKMSWSLGYRKMIRFYAITVWSTLRRLGYEWVMRMDDDSFFLSPLHYNIFDAMRRNDRLYAYRMLSAECPRVFSDFVRDFVARDFEPAFREPRRSELLAAYERTMRDSGIDADFVSMCTKFPRHCRAPAKRDKLRNEIHKLDLNSHPEMVAFAISRGLPYCAALGQYGYYNNWFVTKIDWWRENPNVLALVKAFDASGLIFTHRSNDLIFQTAVLRLFMPANKRFRHLDFTYQHHTMRHNRVNYGGIESGTTDNRAKTTLAAYARRYGGKILPCDVVDRHKGERKRILFVNPGETSTAPSCGLDGKMDFV